MTADRVLDIDCSSGAAVMRPMTDGEAAARRELAAAPDEHAEQMRRRAEALDQVRAHAAADPAFAALTVALGLA